ncbi:MAG: MotA/TolQ/ExbB proton channel family protein [Pseudomonadales bacterium]|nr:MotA/TolQ/ExbB proton channel family protein [Pseudomonadales bacterium]
MKMRKLFSILASSSLLALSMSVSVVQSQALDLDQLLNLVQKGQAQDNKEYNARMQRFLADKKQQQSLLSSEKAERTRLENLSSQKEQMFAANEIKLADEQARLNERLGSLKELFGVLQQVAGDTQGIFEGSIISSQIPGREAFLKSLISKAGSSSELPSMTELEKLWFEMQREMTFAGKISQYNADVVLPSGDTVNKPVVRVGSFNAISDGQYLVYDFEAKKLVELASQPGSRYNGPAADLESAVDGLTGFWIDPSRGQLLKIKGQSATLMERIDQGGIVGYIILALATFGIALAIYRMFVLAAESGRITKQMSADTANSNNALGRLMAVYQKHQQADVETLELHLAEAVSAEVPKLTKGINWIKIISVVAPLLGLLGTVTGMIDVFETMSLFGTGDPKLMAGGISQALITTVLGLVAAIPCVFLHTMANNRSRALIVILDERATGILARKSEMSEGLKAAPVAA